MQLVVEPKGNGYPSVKEAALYRPSCGCVLLFISHEEKWATVLTYDGMGSGPSFGDHTRDIVFVPEDDLELGASIGDITTVTLRAETKEDVAFFDTLPSGLLHQDRGETWLVWACGWGRIRDPVLQWARDTPEVTP